MMRLTDFGDCLTFPTVTPAGKSFHIDRKTFSHRLTHRHSQIMNPVDFDDVAENIK